MNASNSAEGSAEPQPTANLASSSLSSSSEEWQCPRCTLLNPESSNSCEVCEFDRAAQARLDAAETTDVGIRQLLLVNAREERKFMIRFENLHPLVANNVFGTTTSVASVSLIGGLVGGPVGALVGAAGAVVLDGANRLNHHLRRNQTRQRRQVVITKIRMDGATMSITMKTMTRCRKMMVQPMVMRTSADGNAFESTVDDNYWTQLTPRDQRMVQILFLHLLSDTSIPEGHVMNISYEELRDRVIGSAQQDAKKGATQEEIDAHSEILTLETEEDLAKLKDHQKVCNITLEDFKVGDKIRVLKSCGHAYYPESIDEWLHKVNSCPVCKAELHAHAEEGEEEEHVAAESHPIALEHHHTT